MVTLYEVQEKTLCDGWVNNWRMTFNSKEAAQNELDEFLIDCHEAYKAREMLDYLDSSNFRIVQIKGI